MFKSLDEVVAQIEKDETIFCPYCQHGQEDETAYLLNSTNEAVEMDCESCRESFIVYEVADSLYYTFTKEEHEQGLDEPFRNEEPLNGNA